MLAVIKELLGFVETNLSLDDLMALAAVGFNADLSSVEQLRLPVDGTYKTGYVGEYWCIQPNFEQNAKLLHDFMGKKKKAAQTELKQLAENVFSKNAEEINEAAVAD